MSITVIPDFPEAGDPNFSSLAYASFKATKQAVDDLNLVGAAYALSTNTTSVTSNTIGTGSKTFTVQTNLGYVAGMTIRAASTASPINYVTGIVTSYVKTTGVLIITVPTGGDKGSGTFAAWTLSFAATGANSAGDISNTAAGNIVATNVQDAIDELDTEKAGLSANNTFTGSNDFQDITATSIENTPIGASTPSTANVTALTATSIAIGANNIRAIILGTAQATTSGTSKDFTSIPSWVKKITMMFAAFSTNGASPPLVQLGTSSGIESTGYVGAGSNIAGGVGTLNYTTGAGIGAATSAGYTFNGILSICLVDSATNTWVISGIFGQSGINQTATCGSSKSLSATLDRIRLTTVNGTDTFDAGSINILYEG
jgi:hypothetical protein